MKSPNNMGDKMHSCFIPLSTVNQFLVHPNTTQNFFIHACLEGWREIYLQLHKVPQLVPEEISIYAVESLS